MGRVIGYDLTDLTAQVSASVETEKGEEVQSVPVFAGSEKYVMPVAAYVMGDGEILYGEDALIASKDEDGDKGNGRLVTNLLSNAVNEYSVECHGESYEYKVLLAGFIKRTVYLSSVLVPLDQVERVVITLPEPSERFVGTVGEAASFLNDTGVKLRITGYSECFFYYAMNQDAALTKNKVALFDYDGTVVRSMLLYTRVDTRPHLSMIEDREFDMKLKDDLAFLDIARSVLDSEIVSAVYLSGEGFEGGWLMDSINYLCERKRRVFQGRNLYTKGACYAGIDDRDGNPTLDTCRFFDDDKLESNIGLYMIRDGQEVYVPLAEAGVNWYEIKNSVEFMMGEDSEIRIRIESFFTKDVRYSVIRTDNFPKRPDRCTRVRLEVSMKDVSRMSCRAKDLGFGEIYKSSGETVETEILL